MNIPTTTPTPNFEVSGQHIMDMLEAVKNFSEEFKVFFNSYNMEPLPSSIAATELNASPDQREQLETAYSMEIQSIDYACDHLSAFMECIEQPILTIAPFTCVRGLMESCAIAGFLLDPELDYLRRLEHSFSFRREGYAQQIKLAKATSRPEVETRAINSDDRLNLISKNLGFRAVGNQAKSPVRYGIKWPGITSLIGTTLNQESAYRIFSAVAHGHHWATFQLGYSVQDHPFKEGEKVLEKNFHPWGFLYMGQVSIHALATATYFLWELYGWNEKDLKITFEKFHSSVFDILLSP